MSKLLGTIGFRQRGDWAKNTYYRKDDMVLQDRSTRYCKENHTSGETFEEDEAKWGYLTDATGMSQSLKDSADATSAAKAATEASVAQTEEAKAAAEQAAEAAKEATEQTQAAKDATGIFTENFKFFSSDEYLFAISDTMGNLLFAIRHNGSCYQPKGIPDQVQERFEELTSYQMMQSDQYIFAITDSKGSLLFGINRSNGHIVVNGVDGLYQATEMESKNWIYAVLDSTGALLFGVRKDGSFCASKLELPEDVIEAIKKEFPIQETSCKEFMYKITDKDGRILFGIHWDGESYMPKGIPEEQKEVNEQHEKRMTDLEKKLANFTGGTGDWSDADHLHIPTPRLALVNFNTSTMPTAKSGLGTKGVNCDIPCEMEFWDLQGNYFKKWVLLSAQGNSSMSFIKKNLAFDIFLSKDDANNDGDTFELKIGNWVPQDSFHMKAYYTDAFRGVGVSVYKIFEDVVATRSLRENRPYKYLFADKATATSAENDEDTELCDTNAMCHPDGFPAIVYQNGDFYGIYSFQLKKHRDNYFMNKKTAEHIHLDGTLSVDNLWNGAINWTGFEVRNPKSLYMQDYNTIQGESTLEYNGDYPRELMGTDSDYYDKSDKNMKRCATAKKYIEALAQYVPQLKAAQTNGATDDEMREMISGMFHVPMMIDYIIVSQLNNNTDGFSKNWQWTTWDGVKWCANLYDLDMSFGGHFVGNRLTSVPTGWVGNSTSHPAGWIIKYFKTELDDRYKELRDAGLFDPERLAAKVKDWMDRVGEDNYEREWKKWPDSPCHRASNVNTDYWKSTLSQPGAWASTTTYAKNGTCLRSSHVYKSLAAANLGNDPLTDDGTWWEDVTWNEDTVYNEGDVCYYGKSAFYSFQCLAACQGKAPLTGFYTTYPYELGYYDSIYRVLKWIETRMPYVDKLFNYSTTA